MSINPDIPIDTDFPASVARETAYFTDISGEGEYGRPKARLMARYYTLYSDGTEDEHETLVMEKPTVYVFKHAGYVNVFLDFGQAIDQDLRELWKLLERYSSPINSISYTPEELESGFYTDETGQERMVYFPNIDLTLSPIGKEKSYALLGINPAFYTLQARDPDGAPCVLQFTFSDELFHVSTDLQLDYDDIQREAVQELNLGTGDDV